jgi:hypothetical protein
MLGSRLSFECKAFLTLKLSTCKQHPQPHPHSAARSRPPRVLACCPASSSHASSCRPMSIYFRIEIFANIRGGQKGELKTGCPEFALLTAPNIREHFYKKIGFSTPRSAPSCKSADTWGRPRRQPRTHACTQQQQQLLEQHHACRFMHAGSCMSVHPSTACCRATGFGSPRPDSD